MSVNDREKLSNRLAWGIIVVGVAIVMEVFLGAGISDYFALVKKIHEENPSTGGMGVLIITAFFFFFLALGQVLGDVLTEIVWEREKKVLPNQIASFNAMETVSHVASVLVAVQRRVTPLVWLEENIGVDVLAKVLSLINKMVYMVAGITLGLVLAMYMKFAGTGVIEPMSLLMTEVGLFAVLFLALAFTSLPPGSLILVSGVFLVIESMGRFFEGDLVGLGVFQLLVGAFFLMFFIRLVLVWKR